MLGGHFADPEAVFSDLHSDLLLFGDTVVLWGAKAVYDDNSAIVIQASGSLCEKVVSLGRGVEMAEGLDGKDKVKVMGGFGNVEGSCVAE